MKKINKTSLAAILSTAAVSALTATNVQAESNPFGATELSSGYMQLAAADTTTTNTGAAKKAEGSCGEGMCGGMMDGGKMKKDMEGMCGGMMKGNEGSCGNMQNSGSKSNAKNAEGKCGEGMCAGMMQGGKMKKGMEGACGEMMKGKEGACGEIKPADGSKTKKSSANVNKASEGTCGGSPLKASEGSCGNMKK